MRILKFGGKSLSTIKKMQNIAYFIKKCYENDKKLIIIVSAMGSYTENIYKKFSSCCDLNMSKKELAVALSTGETLSSSLMTCILNSINVPAECLQGFQVPILCKGDNTNAIICSISKERINEIINENKVVVIAGFQGINDKNEIVTLGRGGSDTTAAALGAVFLKTVELFSDFDGIYAGDPRENSFKKYNKVSNKEITKLACAGSKVICKRALKIAEKFGIDFISKSSKNPNSSGTYVACKSSKTQIEEKQFFISNQDNLCEISIIFNNYCDFIINGDLFKLINFDAHILKINYHDNQISLLVSMNDKKKIIDKISSWLNILNKKQNKQ